MDVCGGAGVIDHVLAREAEAGRQDHQRQLLQSAT
jgi:hypothetical protein